MRFVENKQGCERLHDMVCMDNQLLWHVEITTFMLVFGSALVARHNLVDETSARGEFFSASEWADSGSCIGVYLEFNTPF